MKIVIKHNFPDVQRQLDQLRADLRDKVLVRAMNRSVEPARPEMAREIAKEFRVTVSKAKDSLRINTASFKRGQLRLEASLESPAKRGRSLNLINFVSEASKARAQGGSGKRTRAQLKFKIKRAGPWKTINGAFVGNKGRTVFIREGAARLPIKALATIDIGQMFNAKRINDRVRKGMLDRFPRIFAEQAKFATGPFNAKRASL